MRTEPARILRYSLLGICAAAMPMLCGGILTQEETRRAYVPSWVVWQETSQILTIRAASGTEKAALSLHGGKLSLCGEDFAFCAEDAWLTADCLVCDIDRDGFDEVILHVWKPGSFGQYQPFWREPDNQTLYSEHLFIYAWDTARADRLDPRWMSSAMPVYGKEVAVEQGSRIRITAPDGSVTRWYWEGWGLVLEESP